MLGRNHPLMRRVRALRGNSRLRRSEGLLVAEGMHLAEEALRSPLEVVAMLVSAELRERPGGMELLDAARRSGTPVSETSARWLDALQDARSPQPVVTLVRWHDRGLDTVPAEGAALVVVAHGIQDPGNLGSIVRTADAAGADAVLACGEAADLTHPRTVRATAGSLFRIAVGRAGDAEVMTRLRQRRFRVLAGAPGGARSYEEVDWTGPVALLLGREGSGLPPELLADVDDLVDIPMRDGVDSLSVGAAAAVLLFAASRQRRGIDRPRTPGDG